MSHCRDASTSAAFGDPYCNDPPELPNRVVPAIQVRTRDGEAIVKLRLAGGLAEGFPVQLRRVRVATGREGPGGQDRRSLG